MFSWRCLETDYRELEPVVYIAVNLQSSLADNGNLDRDTENSSLTASAFVGNHERRQVRLQYTGSKKKKLLHFVSVFSKAKAGLCNASH